jgi:hypothetical protein
MPDSSWEYETENHSLVRQVGLLVTPISMTPEERQVLLEELENGDPTNRGNNASAKKSG